MAFLTDEEAENVSVSAETLAKWLNLSVRTVKSLAAEGKLVKADRGYDVEASLQAYATQLRGAAAGRGDPETIAAKRRLDKARAELAEAKAAREAGTMVVADEVERTWSDITRRIRSRLLAIPSRLAQTFGHLSRMEIGALEREIRDALVELADDAA